MAMRERIKVKPDQPLSLKECKQDLLIHWPIEISDESLSFYAKLGLRKNLYEIMTKALILTDLKKRVHNASIY